jgi:hypothetical protein
MTVSGKLHGWGGALGLAMPVAVVFVTWALSRQSAWAGARRPLFVLAGLALSGFVVSFVALGVMLSRSGGRFGPDVLVGWPNRLEVLLYSFWLLVLAWQARRRQRSAVL